jgi:hypothetical protein
MVVINNWDLKDVNNSVYQVSGPHPEQHYLVSNLGASLGTTGLNRGAKGHRRGVSVFPLDQWRSRRFRRL